MTDPIQGVVAAQKLAPTLDPSAVKDLAQGPKEGPSFQDVMAKQEPTAVQPSQAIEPTAPVQKTEAAAQIDAFVEGVFHDEKKMNRLMDRVHRGQTLSQGQLLELQGVIYGYAQKVDIASKVVDKSTGGLKQVMNTQV